VILVIHTQTRRTGLKRKIENCSSEVRSLIVSSGLEFPAKIAALLIPTLTIKLF
jgi:hypothetical protein